MTSSNCMCCHYVSKNNELNAKLVKNPCYMIFPSKFFFSTEAILSVCLNVCANVPKRVLLIFHILCLCISTTEKPHVSYNNDSCALSVNSSEQSVAIDRLHLVHFNFKLRSSVTKCIFDLFPHFSLSFYLWPRLHLKAFKIFQLKKDTEGEKVDSVH